MIPVESPNTIIYKANVSFQSDVILRNERRINGSGVGESHILTSFSTVTMSRKEFDAFSRVRSHEIENCFLFKPVPFESFHMSMHVISSRCKTESLRIVISQSRFILSRMPQHQARYYILCVYVCVSAFISSEIMIIGNSTISPDFQSLSRSFLQFVLRILCSAGSIDDPCSIFVFRP
jgi:hypothetical protein